MTQPNIVLLEERRGELTLVGLEQAVTADTDFAAVWDAYFAAAGRAGVSGYEYIVWRFEDGALRYLIANSFDGGTEIPDGFTLARIPASDYLVVTHEWIGPEDDLYLKGNMLTQDYAGIGQSYDPRDGFTVPDGYVRDDGMDAPVVQLEIENSSADGQRFERWVPVKRVSS